MRGHVIGDLYDESNTTEVQDEDWKMEIVGVVCFLGNYFGFFMMDGTDRGECAGRGRCMRVLWVAWNAYERNQSGHRNHREMTSMRPRERLAATPIFQRIKEV
jgi:hypothetical protein